MTDDSSNDRRVSTLAGDRPCTGCGYNLVGQPVVRESRYQMLIARCPECGQVASLQEYPLLGRWVGRWTMLLAAGWFLAVLLLAAATGGLLYGLSTAVAQSASEPFAVWLTQRQFDDLKALEAAGALPQDAQWVVTQSPGATPYSALVPSWSSKQDFRALLVEAGGWRRGVDFGALKGWIGVAVAMFVAGCVWALAFGHRRGRGLLLTGVIPIALAVFFALLTWISNATTATNLQWAGAIWVADQLVGDPFIWMTIAFGTVPFAAGLLLGRPITRGLATILLPPRFRSALALLWTTDGLSPPPARRR
jgi:hypothetical protein